MQETLARLAIRRAFARTHAEPAVRDFQEAPHSSGVLRPTLVAIVVSGLGLLGVGGVAMAAASSSSEQAKTSLVQDTNAPDTSHAAPQNLKLDANQEAAQMEAKKTNAGGDDTGGLFGQRGTTPNRNAVRAELSRTLAGVKGQAREKSLDENNKNVAASKAQAEAAERERLMNADIAKVKAEAARIAEEKRKAAELLKQLQEQAAAQKGASQDTAAFKLSADDLAQISKGGGAMPLKPGTYTAGAYFGKTGSWARYHTGQDFPAPTGTPVYAASSGIVGQSRAGGWAGNHIVINHSGGASTLYAHLSGKVVAPGQPVKAGQLIGYVGNTGRSFGAHLHFEYYPPGTLPGDVYSAADPMAWLRTLGVR